MTRMSLVSRLAASLCLSSSAWAQLVWRRSLVTPTRWCSSSSSSSPPKNDVPEKIDEKEATKMAEHVEEALADVKKFGALSTIDEYRMDLESVAKELFVERVDKRILSYPDVIDNDRYFALDQRCINVRKHFASREDLFSKINEEGTISKELSTPLKNLDIFGLRGNKSLGGQGLCVSETCKILEEFSYDMSLSEIVSGANTYGYMGIEKHGTKECKAKYLSKLYSGELVGTVCMADEKCGTDLTATTTTARYEEVEDVYVVNGRKTWVSNANNADVFTVFANANLKSSTGSLLAQIVALVIDKTMPGVEIGPRKNLSGLKGLEVCEVNFNNCVVPASHRLGESNEGLVVFSDMMNEDRVFMGARIASLLREMLNNTLKHCQERKAFDQTLSEFQLVKSRITEMAKVIYALESMTYMTAGLADIMKHQDTAVEAAMTKLYAIKASKIVTENSFMLHGGKAYLENSPFHQLALDLKAFEIWEGTPDLLSMVISINGLLHCQQEDYLKKKEISINETLHATFQRIPKSFTPKLRLPDCVHPSLTPAAMSLEQSILKFGWGIRGYCKNSRMKGVPNEIDHIRLAEAGTELYAMLCSVARANRSYCQGFAHGQHELEIASHLVYTGKFLVDQTMEITHDGFYTNGDFLAKRIAEYMTDEGGYQADHPITRIIYEEQILPYADKVVTRDKLYRETQEIYDGDD